MSDRGSEASPSAGAGPDEPIRVMVVDDHPMWRDGIRADLEGAGVAEVVAEASDGEQAVTRARAAMPEVVLMDLSMRGVSGVEATRRIVEESPHIRVLVLTASGDEADILNAIKVGAAGYLLKSATSQELTDAVRRVARGEQVIQPELAGVVLDEFRRLSSRDRGVPGLTDRENEILVLVAKGLSYGEIADRLFISVKTVQNHVQNILTKLQLHKRWELMRWAIQKGVDRAPE